jgi:hypothetical protein
MWMTKKTQIIAGIVFFFWCGLAMAEMTLDFEVPLPPRSKVTASKTFTLAKREMRALAYESLEGPEIVAQYYKRVLTDQGFKIIIDKYESQPKYHTLRFKKEDLVVTMVIWNKGQATVISIGKYLQPKGTPDLEDTMFYAKDLSLPKQDTPGIDLENIPRPPEAVRIMSLNGGRVIQVFYFSPLEAVEVRKFYQQKLLALGWEIENDTSGKQAIDNYRSVSKNKDLSHSGPLPDINLEEVMAGAYILNLKNSAGKVNITITPNYFEKKTGSLTQIAYYQYRE